jgi:hypothetical protein
LDDALDRHGDGRWRIDDGKTEALLAQNLKIGSQAGNRGLGKGRKLGFTFVPPVSQRALRIDVDQNDRTCARQLRLHGEMA